MIALSVPEGSLEAGRETTIVISVTNNGLRPCTGIKVKITLSDHLSHIGGLREIEVARLEPSLSVPIRMTLVAERSGDSTITVPIFCYTDGNGVTHRPQVGPFTVSVIPRRPGTVTTPPDAPLARRDTVFVSYRWKDTGSLADLLRKQLYERVRGVRVFVDQYRIDLGEDFPDRLDAELRRAVAVLVLIGPSWAPARLHAESDVVRHEIRTALRDVRDVIPVLESGATLPEPDTMPHDVRALAHRNASTIHPDSRAHDVDRLVGDVAAILRRR